MLLDARGGLEIGREVGIAERSVVLTGAHGFEGGVTDHVWRTRIEDKVFLNLGVMVMPGVVIGEGAVRRRRAIVTKDVEPWTMVAGIPAQKNADPHPLRLRAVPLRGGLKVDWR